VTKMRVGVLISGRGSNLQALIEACKAPDYPARIVLVVSNVPSAQGLLRAEASLIPALTINHKDFASREDFDAALDVALGEAGVELLCNAGFMRLHSQGFVEHWRDRHLNIHPSLLPAFKGLHVITVSWLKASRSPALRCISSDPRWIRVRSWLRPPFPCSPATRLTALPRVSSTPNTASTPTRFGWSLPAPSGWTGSLWSE